ncbi:hypothetical protein GCM10027422_29550 [Hymenobacter arcticus]
MLFSCTPAGRAIAVAALIFLAASAAHAQGKVDDAPKPGGHTTANEQAYARAVMADAAQPSKDDAEHANSQHFRQLRYEHKMPVKFTWTEAAAQQLTEKRDLELWTVIENISTDLVRSLGGSRAEYYQAPIRKIKEIHFTTTAQEPTPAQMGAQHGWFYSWNKATGVLTMAMSTSTKSPSPVNEDSERNTSNWILANVK